jgi:hypothetical protein
MMANSLERAQTLNGNENGGQNENEFEFDGLMNEHGIEMDGKMREKL